MTIICKSTVYEMGRGGGEEPHVHTPVCLHREERCGGISTRAK